MKIDLRDLQDGDNILSFDESPEDLHIQNEEYNFIGAIHTQLNIYKLGDSFSAKGETACRVRPECAHCLEPIELPVQVSYAFVFQKGRPEAMEDNEDDAIIWLNEEPGEIDLGEEIKDYILLELPMNPTCAASPDGPCERYDQDPVALLGAAQPETPDPRWDALRALKEKDKEN